jgi:hypothetical protein
MTEPAGSAVDWFASDETEQADASLVTRARQASKLLK